MKKFLMSAAVVVGFGITASAQAASYGTAGCGLGSIVFGNDPGMIQILAATTNGTFATQTFGITSGTSNCGGGALSSIDQKAFTETNYAALSRDAANGEGEYLAAFATLLGCEISAQPEFFAMTQAHYGEIFAPEATPDVTLQNAKNAARANSVLGQKCSRI